MACFHQYTNLDAGRDNHLPLKPAKVVLVKTRGPTSAGTPIPNPKYHCRNTAAAMLANTTVTLAAAHNIVTGLRSAVAQSL